jgi:membrane peptidoglycan carboxypeptidase
MVSIVNCKYTYDSTTAIWLYGTSPSVHYITIMRYKRARTRRIANYTSSNMPQIPLPTNIKGTMPLKPHPQQPCAVINPGPSIPSPPSKQPPPPTPTNTSQTASTNTPSTPPTSLALSTPAPPSLFSLATATTPSASPPPAPPSFSTTPNPTSSPPPTPPASLP